MPIKPVKRHGSPNWYIRGSVIVWRSGRDHRIEIDQTTGTKDYAEACAIAAQIEARVRQRNFDGRAPAKTFRQIAELYIAAGGEARFLDRPLAALGEIPIDQIDGALIAAEGLLAYPGVTDRTRWRQWHTPVKAVLNYPNKRERAPESPARTYYLNPGQVDYIIKQTAGGKRANPWTPALITFLVGQGARMGETLAIEPRRDLFLRYGYCMLRDTKNDTERRVTLSPRVIAGISTLPNLDDAGPLFRAWHGRPFKRGTGHGTRLRAYERAVDRCMLDPRLYTLHVLRHTWATWFYAVTRDVLRLKAEGGWKSEQYQRYTKLASAELAKEVVEAGWGFRGDSAIGIGESGAQSSA